MQRNELYILKEYDKEGGYVVRAYTQSKTRKMQWEAAGYPCVIETTTLDTHRSLANIGNIALRTLRDFNKAPDASKPFFTETNILP